MIVTLDQLYAIARPPPGFAHEQPDLTEFCKAINEHCEEHKIVGDEFCRWLAQCIWECGYFCLLEEPHDQNWLIDHYWAVRRTRWRLGNKFDWQAWRYKGRGLIHLTGLLNYLLFQRWLEKNGYNFFDIVSTPDMISANTYLSVLAGIFFWQYYNVGQESDFAEQTKIINGAYSDNERRYDIYKEAWRILQ